jgi:heat-inducible transcriptional repressor
VKSSLKKNQKLDVKIGSENEIGPMKDLSVVTTLYGIDGRDIGAIGVIGPTRMAYGKVVSSIQFMKDLLNREITRIFSDKG